MKNLFFVPFAYDESKSTGLNVKKDARNTYLKNLCVSLISAKKATPNVDVALVCNIRIPEEYENLLRKNDVLIYVEAFDSFLFPEDYTWCLAFYKLCALEKIVGKYEYDHYIYTDADVFVQASLENVFLELKDNILLYDINYDLNVPDYAKFLEEYKQFGVDSHITHYGGEFFGASREYAKGFITKCKEIFDQMQSRNFVTTMGDEFITSLAAYQMRDMVKNAGAYIYRFWTGRFYLVSTCYQCNEVAILHLPAEKQSGMIRLYDRLVKKGDFPNKKKVHKICHLNGQPLKYRPIKYKILGLVKKIMHK